MIVNTRNTIRLAEEVKYADRIWTRMLGLMGKKKLEEHRALLIYPCQQIHTFFMRFPIDCVFIDKNYKVIHLAENVKPWHVSKKVPKAYGVIELASGIIERTDTKISDRLEICK